MVNKSQNSTIAKESMLYLNNLASILKQIISFQISKKYFTFRGTTLRNLNKKRVEVIQVNREGLFYNS